MSDEDGVDTATAADATFQSGEDSGAPEAPAGASGEDGIGATAGSGRAPIGTLVAVLALVVAVVGIAATGFLWWQYRQFYVALDAADQTQRSAVESVARGNDELGNSIDELRADLREERERSLDLRTTIGDFPQQIGALERRLDALQGRSLNARDVWLRAEAEYYLVVANTELTLSARVENALTALELADGLLRELADPALNPVRVAIADELASLRTLPLIDREGLAFSLASLEGRIDELPFRSGAATSFDGSPPDLDAVEPGFGRLWQSVRQAVLGIVRIERRDEPVETLLSAGERAIARRQLALELEQARVALLRNEQEAFRAGLVAAKADLNRDFDVTAAPVGGAIELLDQLLGLEIAPALPDISRSLTLLRSESGAGNGAGNEVGNGAGD